MTTPVKFHFGRQRRGLGFVWPAILALVMALATYIAARTSSEERVAQLWIAATVADDGSAEVVEVIDYDFGTNSRHGIFRDVPDLRTDAPVRVSSPDAPADVTVIEYSFRPPRLRIGDEDRTISGQHRYVLRYTLDDVASDGRIAWDAVGTGWNVPIEDVYVQVVAAATLERVDCATGASGSTDPCTVSGDEPGQVVAAVGHLDPGEGVTVSARATEPLDAAPPEPSPAAPPAWPGIGALPLATLVGLVALLAGVGAKWLLRRADRHHVPRLGLPGEAPGERTRVDAADLARVATPSSRLPGDLTPSQGAILLANNGMNFWDMADWVAEQAAAGTIGLEESDDGKQKSVVMVRRQDGEGFAREVLDKAFGGRDRLTLGRYDTRFALASAMVKEHLSAWRESSGLWDVAFARRARAAKRLGLVAGLAGLALALVGGSLASDAGTAAVVLAGGGAALGTAGLCARFAFWGEKVLTPEGTAAWLQVESLRQYLTRPPAKVDDDDLPTDRFGDYTAWAVALSASTQWARTASRIAETTRTPPEPAATETSGVFDEYYWIRHASIAQTLTTSCSATSYQPRASSTSSSGGSSYSSSSSSRVGSGSGGGGGGSW